MLVAVVEEGGIGRAASRLFITQPAVSGGLRKLSEEVGVPIFKSCSRAGTTLTPIGKSLYQHARGILAMRDTALQEIQNAADLQRGSVRIGTDETSGLYFFPALAERFCRHYPRVKMQVQVHDPDQLQRMLREESIDVLITCSKPDGKEFVSLPLANDELVLVMAPQHPLALRDSVAVADLQQESIILENQATLSRSKLIESFEHLRTPLNVSFESGSAEMVKKLATRSIGVAVLPRLVVESEIESGQLVTRRLHGFNGEYQIWATRRETTAVLPMVRSFIEIIRSYGAERRVEPDKVLVIPRKKALRRVGAAQVN